MDECYVLELLVIQGLTHSVNLGISFLQEYNLKMICKEEEVERPEEALGIYAKNNCPLPQEWGNTFPCRRIVR